MVNDILYNIFVQYSCIKSVQKQGRNTEKIDQIRYSKLK